MPDKRCKPEAQTAFTQAARSSMAWRAADGDGRREDAAPGIAGGAAAAFLSGDAVDADAVAVEHVEDIDEKRSGRAADRGDVALDLVGRGRVPSGTRVILRALASLLSAAERPVRTSPGAPVIRPKAKRASAPLIGAAFISTAAIGPSEGAPVPGFGSVAEAHPPAPARRRPQGQWADASRSAQPCCRTLKRPSPAACLAGSHPSVQKGLPGGRDCGGQRRTSSSPAADRGSGAPSRVR